MNHLIEVCEGFWVVVDDILEAAMSVFLEPPRMREATVVIAGKHFGLPDPIHKRFVVVLCLGYVGECGGMPA